MSPLAAMIRVENAAAEAMAKGPDNPPDNALAVLALATPKIREASVGCKTSAEMWARLREVVKLR